MGFSTDLFTFLGELSVHNEKDWFNANKSRYENTVREPALEFVRAMKPRLEEISPHYVASDKKVGGSLMRVYRDTRFSKDKRPYKTNVGIHFRHAAGKDVHAPGFYVHIALEECFVGVGLWHPDGPSLKAIRERMIEDPNAWTSVTGARTFRKRFHLAGDALKRPPRGFPKEHGLIEDLKRKDHICVADLETDDLIGDDVVDVVADLFDAAAPYAKYLTEAIGQPF